MTGSTTQTGERSAYPAYKPSGMDWVGDIPEHWEVHRLKHTASINDETLPETTDPDYEFVYVDIGSVDAAKGIIATETYRFEDAPSRARRIVHDGDTIVSTVRTYLRAIAPIQEPDDNLIVSTGFAVVRPRRLDPGYLSYALRSPFFVEMVVSRSTGVSYPAINAPEVGNIGVTIPPLDEQKAVASFLDRETARIDALIEKKQRQIELLQEKRSALISHAVTKGLNPNAKMKDSGIQWLGEIPAHWDIVPIKYLFRLRGGGTPSMNEPEYWNGNIPWVTPKDMTQFRLSSTQYTITREGVVNSAASMIKPGALMIVVRSGILKHTIPIAINMVPVTANQDLRAMLSNGRVCAEYLAYLVHGYQQAFLSLWSKLGSAVDSIEVPDMRNTSVPVPTIDEQKAIISYLDRETAKNFSPLPITKRPRGTSKTIGSIIRGFKIGVTKWMRKNTNIYNIWQRNYYEHIIRNDNEMNRIREYIVNNPARWELDRENPSVQRAGFSTHNQTTTDMSGGL